MGDPRSTRVVIGTVCLGLLLVTALARYPKNIALLHNRVVTADRVKLDRGIPQLAGVLPATPSFVRLVDQHVPARAHYVLIGGNTNFCTDSALHRELLWVAYLLLPRAATCKSDTTWWVLYKPTGPLPSGAHVVVQRPGLTLVQVPPGTRPPA